MTVYALCACLKNASIRLLTHGISISNPPVPNHVRHVYFLPDFLMPCWPVFMGPLPPAFLAISSRAFLSVRLSACLSTVPHKPVLHRSGPTRLTRGSEVRGRVEETRRERTGLLLGLVGNILVVEVLGGLLLGLLVVNGIGTRLSSCQHTAC